MTIGKSIKRAAIRALPRVQIYKRARHCYVQSFGRPPRFFFPRTFNEKLQHRKLFDRDPRLPARADKLAVKDFVRSKLGADWVTDTIWSGPALPPIDQRNWPIPYVIKANNGSGRNVFIRSPIDIDWPRIELKFKEWTKEPYGIWGGEWLYNVIPLRYLVEPFIGELADLPIDYKFWVFGGKVKFIHVDTDRATSHKRAMFDPGWARLPFVVGFPIDERPIERPSSLRDMIEAAETLAEDLPFVRVDLYEIRQRPKFGEMTFYPGCGMEHFDPPEFDLKVGEMWP